jgi:hypothetical protein
VISAVAIEALNNGLGKVRRGPRHGPSLPDPHLFFSVSAIFSVRFCRVL